MGIKNQNIYFQSTRDIKDDTFYCGRKDMRTCSVCGKEFFAPLVEMWGYKHTYQGHSHKKFQNRVTWFCSWHCMSEFEKHQRPKTSGQWATRK